MGEEGAATPSPAPPKTTTSGAQALFQTNAWLTAAAVAVYTTKALWVKLREMGFGKEKKEDNKEGANTDSNTEHANANLVDDSFPEDLDQEIDQPQSKLHSQLQLNNVEVS
ncbi:uncharacterized protein LOC117784731 isoform X1 [Drosophila innubila]|uniref:uncharacterized protein LOC117784731 isoform X1 n=1 Tax=Drosophila innubila TaxID=198719 RepID=UPI00148D0040|nr:uncharacterized protein LOC117784731 isoform X1 [Drosophila innubila]